MAALSSCLLVRPPSLTITDTYVLVKNPGQSWYIAEVIPKKMDSVFNYPAAEKLVWNYNLVYRKNNKPVNGSKRLKLEFHKRYARYKWMYWFDYPDRGKYFSDTFPLKPFTWYNLNASNNNSYEYYLYWKGTPGNYIVKEKPKPGAW
jgi:hypothetical protein